jgi:hypothetical protein
MTDTASSTDRSVRILPIEPGGEVEFRLSTHDLRIRAVDGDKVVIRARHGDDDLERHLEFQTGPGYIRVIDGPAGTWRLGPIAMRTGHNPDLEVDVPRNVRLAVRTISGDVTAVGLGASSRWMTASGDLRLGVEAGPVVVETVSGDVRIESGAELDVTARTVSGDVRVRAPRVTAVDAATTTGDIEIDAAMAEHGRHALTSVSGDVRLVTGSEVRVESSSVAGELRAAMSHKAEGSRGKRVVIVGSGRVLVSVKTMSGDVSVRPGAPDAAAPTGRTPMPEPTPRSARSEVRWGPAESPTPGVPEAPAPAPAPAMPPAPALPAAPEASAALAADPETERLEVLRALERGELDVDAAWARLVSLDDAGSTTAA